MLMVALFNLMNVALLICLKRNSCITLRGLGWTLLILQVQAEPSLKPRSQVQTVKTALYDSNSNQAKIKWDKPILPANANDQSQFRFWRDVVVVVLASFAFEQYLLPIRNPILLGILFSLLEYGYALFGMFLLTSTTPLTFITTCQT